MSSAGDIFYFQLILLEFPKVSWDDAKSFNGTQYHSFQQAAIAAGLVTEVTAALECFNIFKEVSTGPQLRGLFASMTIQGFPTIPIFEDEDGKYHLSKDFIDRGMSPKLAHNDMLKDLARRLAYDDKVSILMPVNIMLSLRLLILCYVLILEIVGLWLTQSEEHDWRAGI